MAVDNLARLRELMAGVEETEHKLAKRTRMLQSIVNNALDAIIIMGANGCIHEWNPSAVKISGYTRAEAVGKELAALIVPEELRDAHRAGIKRYLATRNSDILDRRINLEAIRSNGERFPMELVVVEITGSAPLDFAGFIRDLTESIPGFENVHERRF